MTPLQVATPFSGMEHGVQLAPQELTLVLLEHWPPQSWVPAGHVFIHAIVEGIHAPAQRRWFAGQAAPQLMPSHVTVPPVGAAQAVQDKPQWAGEVLSTHVPLQT